ncbi:hypothetical protein [Bailinhaonella thermotolerans]|uniref:hypothetical protein n=1 Tax=Bailinhaonella thermotolerans TaxID=1070861 RepID=UPI00192A3595|nr:hypothetical protein [Bailinhaonella thermotolerans]
MDTLFQALILLLLHAGPRGTIAPLLLPVVLLGEGSGPLASYVARKTPIPFPVTLTSS